MTNIEINTMIQILNGIVFTSDAEKRDALAILNALHREMDSQSWQKINGTRKSTYMKVKKMQTAIHAVEARIGGVELVYSNDKDGYAIYPAGLGWFERKAVKGWR